MCSAEPETLVLASGSLCPGRRFGEVAHHHRIPARTMIASAMATPMMTPLPPVSVLLARRGLRLFLASG
jgi:hypothetical protein